MKKIALTVLTLLLALGLCACAAGKPAEVTQPADLTAALDGVLHFESGTAGSSLKAAAAAGALLDALAEGHTQQTAMEAVGAYIGALTEEDKAIFAENMAQIFSAAEELCGENGAALLADCGYEAKHAPWNWENMAAILSGIELLPTAQHIAPLPMSFDPEDGFTAHAQPIFDTDADADNDLVTFDIYCEAYYDAVEMQLLQVGGMISVNGTDVTVTSLEVNDGVICVNGEYCFLPGTSGGVYCLSSQDSTETPMLLRCGTFELALPDTAVFRNGTEEQTGADFLAYARETPVSYENLTILVEDGAVREITLGE